MLRYALPRFYFGIIGVLLLTLPLFAALRYPVHQLPHVGLRPLGDGWHCLPSDQCIRIPYDGASYAVWQGGLPPHDYWPLAVALLAAGACVDYVVRRYRSHRERR